MKTASKITIFGDGGSRSNPGEAAYGFAIFDKEGSIIFTEGKRIGIASNNVAEYSSVTNAFKWVKNNLGEIEQIDFYLDSLLVASQMSGKYRVKHPDMKRFFQEAKDLEKELGAKVTYSQVPRAENKIADKLVNDALDNLI
jgi:ribonuclease HI